MPIFSGPQINLFQTEQCNSQNLDRQHFSWARHWAAICLLRTTFKQGFFISSLFPNHHPITAVSANHLINPRFLALLPPVIRTFTNAKPSSAGYYFTQLANSQRFSRPLRSRAEHRTGESTNYSIPRRDPGELANRCFLAAG